MKNYPPQFKADAVALYQSRPEAMIRQVAADLGINPETLRNWVRAVGVSRPRGRRAEVPTEPWFEAVAVHSGQVEQHREPGCAFDERADRRLAHRDHPVGDSQTKFLAKKHVNRGPHVSTVQRPPQGRTGRWRAHRQTAALLQFPEVWVAHRVGSCPKSSEFLGPLHAEPGDPSCSRARVTRNREEARQISVV